MHRYVVFHTIFDDQLEYATKEEVSYYCKRLVAIFRGDSLAPGDPGYFNQAAVIRDEFRAFMPEEWMKRLADTFYTVTRYGALEEVTYKANQTVPSLALFKVIREYSIVIFPYFYLVDAQVNLVLTEDVERHPVIQRVRSLWSRIIAWQNDIQGLKKELSKDTEVMNIVIVLQRKYNLSLEDALIEAMKIHDDDLAELVALQADLPDFGIPADEIKQLFHGWGSLIQGLNTFYLRDTNRYDPSCFAWPDTEPAIKKS
ncbi:terpene synthase family protein [Belliella marina]|uniref:Terpene synthase n=1 Tax=Belliella marina TaxID=1644146 RepID=A0ABW4VIS3_9BACT